MSKGKQRNVENRLKRGKFFTDLDGNRVIKPNEFFNIDEIQFERHTEESTKVTFTMDYKDALDLVQSAKRCKQYDFKKKKHIKDSIMKDIELDSLKQCLKTFLKISRLDPKLSQFDFADQETISDDEDDITTPNGEFE